MKKLLVFLIGLTILSACEKGNLFEKNKKDKPCAIVTPETMPSSVTTAFQKKYPGVTVEKWFNKDNTGYCALFTLNGKKTLTQFNNDGGFVREETEVEQQGNHQDGNNNDSGCECETEEGD